MTVDVAVSFDSCDRLLRDVIELVQRAADRAGGSLARGVDHARDFGAVVHHRAREGEAAFFDRLDGLIGGGGYLTREMVCLLRDRGQHAAALFGQDRGHFVGATADGGRDLVGLADEVAGDFFAHPDKRALCIARACANGFGGRQRELTERALGFRRVDLDRLAQLLEARIERIGGGLAAGLDLVGDGFGAADQQFLEAADAAVEIVGDLERAGAQGLVHLADLDADRIRDLGRRAN